MDAADAGLLDRHPREVVRSLRARLRHRLADAVRPGLVPPGGDLLGRLRTGDLVAHLLEGGEIGIEAPHGSASSHFFPPATGFMSGRIVSS